MNNLDAMSREELLSFWMKHQSGRNYRELFPEGGKGSKKAAGDLANYASNKATAMSCRVSGDIERAMMYESIADRIYAVLPAFAQW